MAEHNAENDAGTKCRYMEAAYPDLDADETCSEHRHDGPTFALARAMAVAFQQPQPTDEQVGWCMDDAAAVVDDFDPAPLSWTVSETRLTRETGLDFTFDVNGVEYVIQTNDSGGHVEVHPVSRSEWESWMDEADGEWDEEDCQHEWELRSEHDTWVCAWCQAETNVARGDHRMTRRTPADDMFWPAVCRSCRTLHDAGKVEVVARYTDCSCWRCPNCGLLLDDRSPRWGGTPTGDEARRMARQGTCVLPPGEGNADA